MKRLVAAILLAFVCITALSAMVYYRRRVLSTWQDALTLGILPLASVVFLAYIAIKNILSAPAAQNYALLGFAVVGILLILVARFWLKSPFFAIKRETWTPGRQEG